MKLLQQYLRDARFLIIDEDFANVRLLESQLENSGRTNVRSTTDPRSAFALFTEFQPDLVLLGLTTQNLDGLALMAHIRGALPPDSYLPIIALTETGGPAKRMAALEAGARDFLHMPVDADELDLRICNLLEARFLHLGLQQEKRALETRMGERTHELEHAMRELRESQQQVIHQQRLTAFSEMAGGVVHDFNNNLMVLLGYIEMLLEPANIENPPILREGLSVMRHAAKDAAQVVQRLRQFYRPRADDEHYTSVRVADLARQAFELAQPK